jgi:hypothetical protein
MIEKHTRNARMVAVIYYCAEREIRGGALEHRDGGMREGAPKIPEFLRRGSFVLVAARIGNDLAGYVCDRDGSGLLLDVRDPSGDPHGYEFLPWASIERVSVEE